ncbi:pyruvate formate-lyase-activating protein [Clostridium saccharoperbutylacetonicum]|uniref:Pyruvate formate-lyase-activating enzyme n=1 Tax=Clostridium saccharoperbutylacetonicum N1-4(HMT) TaxID=931276 RepID=M1MXZ5_9CLOT|nr:pyruvate formate-lyase-activating protein [Clostridium saccharoperbutylacetonicum]AGF56267.1 pyruvate formate-lyase-activating enzyme Act [Clostridium saccharoperbutylacetonicum N1-4(HMT)]AQR95007.1 pyruvate formate-lyase 1-activating enzyme [Clostridium saccharoperbutylacetonicum]NRT62990.1 pyruvate formate lyase activating enzyme [Clostridium saccharoperbutylacetonicum]NSB26347.1 pyruvate formate lyase activating enzyme [Clostridium saccharoperbutylacetonicum]NSB30851.1 pyruvate formate l
MAVGKIHSIETMGLVDGPGIRVVVFLQGCALRCKFCHNPDTWAMNGGEEYTPEQLVKKIERFKSYFSSSGGGVTFSGGEPLRQPEFLLECLKLCKSKGINTCIDTAGYGFGDYDEILKYTDLVLFDIKHITREGYKNITLMEIDESLNFLEAMKRNNTKMWIRHVVVPGITDGVEHLKELKEYIDTIPNVEKVELLPYHLLGKNKYDTLEIKYPLEGVKAMDKDLLKKYQKEIFEK